VILSQGDVGDTFYIIAEGQVCIQVNHVQVGSLETGSYFGELALLSNERRSATVIASVATHCLVLGREEFRRFVSPLDNLITEAEKRITEVSSKISTNPNQLRSNKTSPKSKNSNGVSNGEKLGQLNSKSQLASLPTAPKPIHVQSLQALFLNTSNMFDLSQLERIRRVAHGTFGCIFLVRQITTDKFYALKIVHKQRLKETGQENCIYSERDTMLSLVESQFVAALYATLQDNKSIYFVQQFVPGGDLFSLLYGSQRGGKSVFPSTKEGGIPIEYAAFYAVNAITAIHHLHHHEIIHRDLKIENFVSIQLRMLIWMFD